MFLFTVYHGMLCFYLQSVMVFTLVRFTSSSYGDFQYPLWSDIMGWLVVCLEISFIPGVAIYKVCTADRELSFKQVRSARAHTHTPHTPTHPHTEREREGETYTVKQKATQTNNKHRYMYKY